MTNKTEERREFNNEAITQQWLFADMNGNLTLKQYLNFREWYINR